MEIDPTLLMFDRAARETLACQLTSRRAKDLVQRARQSRSSRLRQLPREQTIGARLMLRLAAASVALYTTLLDDGHAPQSARALVASTMMPLYDRVLAVLSPMSTALQPDPQRRLEQQIALTRRHAFNPPAWQTSDVTGREPAVCFDIHRCPLADYFEREGLSELCVDAFCEGDELIAERFGVILERKSTLAAGASHCDFCWRLPTADD